MAHILRDIPVAASSIQRIDTASDLVDLVFADGVAEVEVTVEAMDDLPIVSRHEMTGETVAKIERSIRMRGFNNGERIIAYKTPDGRLLIVDGAARLAAARNVAAEFWTNLSRRKVKTIQMIIFEQDAMEVPVEHQSAPTFADYADDDARLLPRRDDTPMIRH